MAYTIISQNNNTTTLSDGVNTITVPSRVNLTSGNFTIVEVNNNMATLEDGDGNVYRDIPCVATLAGEGGGGGSSLPDQTGHSGEFLTTDGTDASWAAVNALPDQTGNAGKFLTTDGSSASWSDKPLQNTATGRNSLSVLGTATTQANNINIGVGSDAAMSVQQVVIGTNAYARGTSSVCIGYNVKAQSEGDVVIGTNAQGDANNHRGKIIIGYGAKATAAHAIQFGSGNSGTTYTNSDANTFKVGNANGNFEIMDANGNLPADRLASTTGLADGNYRASDYGKWCSDIILGC